VKTAVLKKAATSWAKCLNMVSLHCFEMSKTESQVTLAAFIVDLYFAQ
jgi:hypothetical protein